MALLLNRGHTVRALVRTQAQADALESIGAQPVLADLRGDVEWTADGCDAAIFAAGARHRSDLPAIDAGGAAKLAEAADRYDLRLRADERPHGVAPVEQQRHDATAHAPVGAGEQDDHRGIVA
jgi:uncharacterized protein YbjT (DUF2867 family)